MWCSFVVVVVACFVFLRRIFFPVSCNVLAEEEGGCLTLGDVRALGLLDEEKLVQLLGGRDLSNRIRGRGFFFLNDKKTTNNTNDKSTED